MEAAAEWAAAVEGAVAAAGEVGAGRPLDRNREKFTLSPGSGMPPLRAVERRERLQALLQEQAVRSARKRRRADNFGDDVKLSFHLPATFATLFALAAGLLLGYIQ